MRSSFLVIFFLLFAFTIGSTRAEIFEVSSNADAGQNTLREALIKAAANGDAETDQIVFNLPNTTIASRTITLLTALPEITSKLIIDGSSQPGTNLGVSGAKVVIEADRNSKFHFFTINKIDVVVEIYGLKLFKAALALPFQFEQAYGISINTKSKVTIGAPGKGNVICGFWAGIFGNIGDSKIQSNFIGVLEDGNTAAANLKGIIGRPRYDYLENALIGGEQRDEGNLISANETGISFDTPSTSGTSEVITIINNSIGTNFTETAMIAPLSIGFSHISTRQSVTLIVKKNVFAPNLTGLQLHNSTQATLLGNFFGTNRTQGILSTRMNATAVSGNSFVKLIIGGENAGDDNVFTNYQNPISVINASSALVVKNNFYCNAQSILTLPTPAQDFKILGIYPNKALGKAPPNSLIQLYYSENSCGPCNPKERFGTATTNANGFWEYNGPINGPIMGSASLNGNSIGFEPVTLQDYELIITHQDCNQKGGVEVINKREGNYSYEIKDSNGNMVSTNQDEKNLLPGTYYLELTMIGGCTTKKRIDIFDYSPITYPTTITLPCNVTEGTFNGGASVPRGGASFFWEDENGVVFANTQTVKLKAGKYYFYLKDAVGCLSNKSLFTVLDAPLPALIDDSSLQYEDADCGLANGSIKQMKITIQTGTVTYSWQNQIGQNFGSGIDLVNAPAGQYRLAVFTNTSCGVIYSAYYTVKEKNSISLDETNALGLNASCGINNGKVTGVIATGTNLSYEWINESGDVVGTALELSDVSPGKYYLLVKNNNCEKKSRIYTVGLNPSQQFPAYTVSITNTSCQLDNGSLAFSYGVFTPPKSVRWVRAGITVGTNPTISDLPAGKYSLYLTNDFGCENFFQSYTIDVIKPLVVDFSGVTREADVCGTKTGNIKGITATSSKAVSFYWKDENNITVATTANLENVSAGRYTLTVTDGLNTMCSIQGFLFIVEETKMEQPVPTVSDVKICAAGSAKIVATSVNGGNYKLYQNQNDPFPIQNNTTGVFMVDVTKNSTYYVTLSVGNCESNKVPANIIVADTDLSVPKSFSPNGDGINDLWRINNLDSYPNASVKIFTRNGSLIYKGSGTSAPFDGSTANGRLPVGTYYYVIVLRKGCAVLYGAVTLLR